MIIKKNNIAIVGMAGRFPESDSIEALWENLKENKNCISNTCEQRFYNSKPTDNIKYNYHAGLLKDIEGFDANFFKIVPREAKFIDPQQRMVMESVWSAIEDANHLLEDLQNANTGVFIGASNSDYHRQTLENHEEIGPYSLTGACNAIISNRVSFFYNFTGPSMTIDTACSSSLVALDIAVGKLASGEIEYAIVGGVNSISSPEGFLCCDSTGILSPEGQCKVFDDSASGYVRGEGVGIVLLKKLDHAIADNNDIYCIIKSTATNQDGLSNGLSAPNPKQQKKLLKNSLEKANLTPEDINYIEAHGTGTPLGDPMEIKSIQEVYSNKKRNTPLYIGAIKSNIGHLEAAAGIAALIKTALVLKNNYIPANLHLKNLNKNIKIIPQDLDIIFPTKNYNFNESKENINNAALSSFGVGGTNSHAILSKPPSNENHLKTQKKKPYYIVTLSGKTQETLDEKCHELLIWLKAEKRDIEALSLTSNKFRTHFNYRTAFLIESSDDLIEQLSIPITKQASKEISDEKLSTTLETLNIEDKENYKQQLNTIINAYLTKKHINWDMLHENESKRKIKIPQYPFYRKKYWFQEKPSEENIQHIGSTWQNATLSDKNENKIDSNCLFISFSSTAIYETYANQISKIKNESDIPLLSAQNNYNYKIDGNKIYMDFLSPEHYKKLIKYIIKKNPKKIFILNLLGLHQNPESTELSLDNSIYPLYYLAHNIETNRIKNEIQYDVIFISTAEAPKKSFSSISAMLKSWNLENPNVHGKVIKIKPNNNENKPACLPINELFQKDHLPISEIYYLKSNRMIKIFKKIDLAKNQFINKTRNYIGPYIVVGGLGGLGKIVVSMLIEHGYQNIILIGSSKLTNENEAYLKKLQKSISISFYQVDAKNYTAVKEAITAIRGKNGPIKGLIYSAGIKNDNLLIKKTQKNFSNVLNSKIFGVENFDKATKNEPLDFFITFSSIVAITGNIGQTDYAYANRYLHEITDERNKKAKLGKRSGLTISIAWPLIKNTGMAKSLNIQQTSYLKMNYGIIPMPQSQIKNILTYAISHQLTQYIVHSGTEKIIATLSSTTPEEKNPVAEYYDGYVQTGLDSESKEEIFLTFAPFPTPLKGFSWLRTFFDKESNQEHKIITLDKQKEMRSILLRNINFNTITDVLDIGCGHASDLINIAKLHSNINLLHGFTISPKQALVDQKKIEKMKLDDRVTIYCRDSSKDLFPKTYNLVYGYEVTFHIKNKENLFNNISNSLKDNGKLVLADFTSNVRTSLNNEVRGTYISTKDEWSKLLATNNIRLTEVIDISPEIAHFLYDPDFSLNIIKHKTKIALIEEYHDLYNNISTSLSRGLVSYILINAVKDTEKNIEELIQINSTLLESPAIYSDILNQNKNLIIDSQSIFKSNPTYQKGPENNIFSKIESQAESFEKTSIKDQLVEIFTSSLELDTLLNENLPFNDAGIDSIAAVEIVDAINQQWNLTLEPTTLFDYPTIKELTNHIEKKHTKKSQNKVINNSNLNNTIHPEKERSLDYGENDIAIIGMAGKFPQANNLEEFWELLKEGKSAITEIPDHKWNIDITYSHEPSSNKTNSKWGAFLNNNHQFDSLFFNISPAESEEMDPQQGLFLETAWKAIEDAGYSSEMINEHKCSVYVGVATSDHPEGSLTGNSNAILAARIAYNLNLKGASMAVDTACSSSLVAVHLGVQSILNGDTDMVLAGGISLYNSPNLFITASQLNMLSPTGTCYPMDARADGMVLGEGVGVVVLKKLTHAIRDKDNIHGIISGSGFNQNGKTNGITAPSKDAQSFLQQSIYEKFNIDPLEISFIELQGTGTPLGDSIEIAALKNSFNLKNNSNQFCAVSSLKANIGHTSMAAGVTSLIKVLLQIKNRKITPSINYKTQNPKINFKNTPFYVNTQLKDWDTKNNELRTAAVNSFGFSGTNCHMIIKEYKNEPPAENSTPLYLIALSGHTPENLTQKIDDLQKFIKTRNHIPLMTISYTLNSGRTHFPYRIAILAKDIQDFLNTLDMIIQNKPTQKWLSNINSELSSRSNIKDQFLEFCLEKISSNTHASDNEYKETLHSLAQLYIDGFDINWRKFYKNTKRNITSLPTYPFKSNCKNRTYAQEEKNNENLDIHKKFSYGITEALKVPHHLIDSKKSLRDYGFDSITMTKYANLLSEKYGINLKYSMLSEKTSINELCEKIKNTEIETPISIETQANKLIKNELDKIIPNTIPSQNKKQKIENIFLTGANGFLGCYILNALLKESKAKIYCLIRSNTNEAAYNKLNLALKKYNINIENHKNRIKVICGDIEKENLGIELGNYNFITKNIDVIIHNAAKVNYLYSYSGLEDANVKSCIEIIKISTINKLKKIHFISSLAVFTKNDSVEGNLITEIQSPQHPDDIQLGYAKTKYVAEKIFQHAKEKGLDINIYRIDRISGDTVTGSCQEKDFFWNLIKIALTLRAFPSIQMKTNLSPVDKVASLITEVVLKQNSTMHAYHIRNSSDLDFSRVLAQLKSRLYDFEIIPTKEWLEKISINVKKINDEMNSFLPILLNIEKYDYELPVSNKMTFDMLDKKFIDSFEITENLLEKYINYFIESGFLPKPLAEKND